MTDTESFQALSEMQSELAALEALPIEARTPEALERASVLFRAIRAHKRAVRIGRSPSSPGLSESNGEPSSPVGSTLIGLKLDPTTHARFKRYCKQRRTTMTSMLRAYVLKCVE